MSNNCYCQSGKIFEECCKPYIDDSKLPDTAEALMRSRYSAFVIGNEAYLLATHHPDTRPDSYNLDDEAGLRWKGLRILNTGNGTKSDTAGTVEFIARFEVQAGASQLHELSKFQRLDGRWYYLDGDTPKSTPVRASKIGRNEPCSCGSGKKYKKCCGA
jgi:SEC-C motif-containing protein